MHVVIIGEIMAAFAKSLFSCFFANTFAWSLAREYPWPFNFAFVFSILSLLAFQDFKLSGWLPKSLNRARREPVQPRYAVTMFRANDDENDEDEFELSSRMLSQINLEEEQKVNEKVLNIMTNKSAFSISLGPEHELSPRENNIKNKHENIEILIEAHKSAGILDSQSLPFV